MPRRARLVIPGLPHHITHRGNRRCDVFKEIEDGEIYLRLLRKFAEQEGTWIWAFALMPNHVHLIVVPNSEDSLAATIRAVHGTYATVFNTRYDVVGHLWQSRYYSCAMDDDHLSNALRYVERNPVRAGLVNRAEDYIWSSAAPHCGLRTEPLLSDDLPLLDVIKDWSAWLADSNASVADGQLRRCTFSGYPYASDKFVRDLEHKLGRPILRKKRGRPTAD